MEKNRIEYYDVVKGIGIILVVWAHARGPYQSYIYQFHMPLFFVISGLLYSEKKSVKAFIKGKINSLYIPFAFWNLLIFCGKSVYRHTETAKILKQSLEILLTLSKDGEFLGATWFLGALFAVSVAYKLIDANLSDTKEKPYILLTFFLIVMITGINITLPYMLSRTCVLSGYYAIGVFVKKAKGNCSLSMKDQAWLAVLAVLLFLVIGRYNSANMGANTYTYPFLFIIGAGLASYAVITFAKLAEHRSVELKAKKVLVFLGKRSIDIVIWQFVAFRFVIAIQILSNHEELSMAEILSHYPVYSSANGWWVLYILAGLILPILFVNLLGAGPWGKVFKRLHII